jgi:hypothetical protein
MSASPSSSATPHSPTSSGGGSGAGGSPPAGDLPGGLRPNYREITLSAMLFGVVVGIIMNAAITYAGLKIGFTSSGSAIAAVLGFGVLRGILRRGSILETNIGQTIASSVNTSQQRHHLHRAGAAAAGHSPRDRTGSDFWLITLAWVRWGGAGHARSSSRCASR